MPTAFPSQVLRFIASIPGIIVLFAHPTAAAQQKPAPRSPQSQARLEEHVKNLQKRLDATEQKATSTTKELEARLNAAEQKAASAAKDERVVTMPAVLAFAALCVSFLNLWKGHFARFSPLALAGNLQHRIYPIRNGDQRWYITSFDIPVSVTNPGARPGSVTGLRVRLHYPEVALADNHEFVHPKWELKPDKVTCIDKNRFKWIHEVVAADWSPFVILPKATAAKHLVFETKWDKPVVQTRIVATLEIQADRRPKWLTVTEWHLRLLPEIWAELENGGSMGYFPVMGPIPIKPDCSPTDLHKHTGTMETLPTKGPGTAAKPSYLDYPESKKD
jgi:hypothetical protein